MNTIFNKAITMLKVAAFLVLAFGVGYFLASLGPKRPDPTTYQEDKPFISVTLDQPVFKIQLAANPGSTGYNWYLIHYNPKLIEPMTYDYTPGKAPLGMVGVPGQTMWVFKARRLAFSMPQQTTLTFILARPWEPMDPTARKLVFTVTTQADPYW